MFVLLLLFGTAAEGTEIKLRTWQKAGATPQDFMRDNAACEKAAASDRARKPETARIVCLESKGWRLATRRK